MDFDFNQKLLIGFACSILLAMILLRDSSQKSLTDRLLPANIELELLHALPSHYVSRVVSNASAAKNRKLFWASSRGQVDGGDTPGVAVDALANPDLLLSIFPGYSKEMASDKDLWDKYFHNTFMPANWIESLSRKSRFGVVAYTSWGGCLDIIRKYGADILIVGSSEVYEGISVDSLSKRLNESGLASLKDLRILMCANSEMLPDMVSHTVEIVHDAKIAKIKYFIWGYSFWNAYTRSPALSDIVRQRRLEWQDYLKKDKALDALEQLAAFSRTEWKFSAYLPELSWDFLFPVNYDRLWRKLADPMMATANDSILYRVPIGLADDLPALNGKIREFKPDYYILNGITEKDCEISLAETELKSVLKKAGEVAEKIVIYITPTTPLQTDVAPRCFRKNVEKMLGRLPSAARTDYRLSSLTGDWASYGLNYYDFLYPTSDSRILKVNANHANFLGAAKVANKLGDEIVYQEGLSLK